MHILAISGSLRRDSHNAALLRAAGELLSPLDTFELWEGLREVPPYDEDGDVEPAPPAVAALRAAVASADAVLFSTPEYNSSVPGALKNALDWASRPIATNVFRNEAGRSDRLERRDVRRASGRRPSSARCSARWVPASPRSRSRSAGRREKFDADGRLVDDEVRESSATPSRRSPPRLGPPPVAA